MLNYMTVKQAAEKWGVAERTVHTYLKNNRIEGVVRPGYDWLIPMDAERPADMRWKKNRQPQKETEE